MAAKLPFSLLTSLSLLFLTPSPSSAQLQNGAQALISSLRSSIEAKDLSAASHLVEWGNSPIAAQRLFKMSLIDCFPPAQCSLEPLPFKPAVQGDSLEYTFSIPPEGQIRISLKGEKDGLTLPYAKVAGGYRIIIGQLSPNAYAQAKEAADARKIAENMDPDLVRSGSPLPSGGNQFAQPLKRYLEAIASGDTDYLAQHGAASDRYFFGKAYKDKPLKAAVALELARLEIIPQPTIKEGFALDSRAILLFSGKSGQGWPAEGAFLFTKSADGTWELEDKAIQSYPPSRE